MAGKKVKAVALMSGVLDSTLAVKLVEQQGIEVVGVNFKTPFFGPSKAKAAAERLGVELIVLDITGDHMEIVKHPKHGYGRFMNPCIDCHAYMVRRAGEVMREVGASFIITGEVLGERPKSQNPQALKIVERDSGYEGHILRPLSAKLLEPTIPEKEGVVDREKLLDIQGRSRKRQFELAKEVGITEYPSPAGGCLLTDPVFSGRLRQLFKEKPDADEGDVELQKVGRHFEGEDGSFIVVGRNEAENDRLLALAGEGDLLLEAKDIPGPITLLRGTSSQNELRAAAALTARYGKARSLERVEVWRWRAGEEAREIEAVDYPPEAYTIEGHESAIPLVKPRKPGP